MCSDLNTRLLRESSLLKIENIQTRRVCVKVQEGDIGFFLRASRISFSDQVVRNHCSSRRQIGNSGRQTGKGTNILAIHMLVRYHDILFTAK